MEQRGNAPAPMGRLRRDLLHPALILALVVVGQRSPDKLIAIEGEPRQRWSKGRVVEHVR